MGFGNIGKKHLEKNLEIHESRLDSEVKSPELLKTTFYEISKSF